MARRCNFVPMSRLFVPTLKVGIGGGRETVESTDWVVVQENPRDAVAASHVLLTRAGFTRQVAAGVSSTLPLGLRVLEKIERIIDEEMQAIG